VYKASMSICKETDSWAVPWGFYV